MLKCMGGHSFDDPQQRRRNPREPTSEEELGRWRRWPSFPVAIEAATICSNCWRRKPGMVNRKEITGKQTEFVIERIMMPSLRMVLKIMTTVMKSYGQCANHCASLERSATVRQESRQQLLQSRSFTALSPLSLAHPESPTPRPLIIKRRVECGISLSNNSSSRKHCSHIPSNKQKQFRASWARQSASLISYPMFPVADVFCHCSALPHHNSRFVR